MKIWVVMMCLLSLSVAAAGQAPGRSEKRESRAPAVDQQEIQGLTNDVARMRALVQQMQMNLALVQTTPTPLKHQFELEIEMWQVALEQMERRLQRLRGTSTGGVVSPGTVPLQQGSRQGKP